MTRRASTSSGDTDATAEGDSGSSGRAAASVRACGRDWTFDCVSYLTWEKSGMREDITRVVDFYVMLRSVDTGGRYKLRILRAILYLGV